MRLEATSVGVGDELDELDAGPGEADELDAEVVPFEAGHFVGAGVGDLAETFRLGGSAAVAYGAESLAAAEPDSEVEIGG